MRHNKKASLELSINAIVIIILAISLLGLGLMFMKNFMSKGSEQFGSIIEGTKIENPASPINPLTYPSEISMASGETKTIDIGFYCDQATPCGSTSTNVGGLRPFIISDTGSDVLITNLAGTTEFAKIYRCSPSTPTKIMDKLPASQTALNNNEISFTALPTTVTAHTNVGFKATIKTGPVMTAGTYLCTIFVANSKVSDVVIQKQDDKAKVYTTGQIKIIIE